VALTAARRVIVLFMMKRAKGILYMEAVTPDSVRRGKTTLTVKKRGKDQGRLKPACG
jgi:hypothetical protein